MTALLKTRAEQIFERFKDYHLKHPEVWEMFERFTLELIRRGRKHYGVACVIERIRWEAAIRKDLPEDLKINNDFRAYYSRMWAAKYPQHAQFFQMRRRTSADKEAYANDIPFLINEPAGSEDQLKFALWKLLPDVNKNEAGHG